jgi:hypothetical protein
VSESMVDLETCEENIECKHGLKSKKTCQQKIICQTPTNELAATGVNTLPELRTQCHFV